MTSLTVNGSSAAATTLAAAGKLFSATGGTSGNVSTKVGTSTQFKQIFAKGTSTNQTGVASLPAPTDSNFNGWMWDVTTLEGQQIIAGTWTPTIHLLASTSTTVTPTVEWYKRSSGGVYTQIGTVAGSSIALTTSSQALTFTPPSLSAMNFATGDKLVMWLWVNQTAGGATNSTISVVEATSASSAGVVSEAQAATPGYVATPALAVTCAGTGTLSATLSPVSNYASVVLADSPLRYYRLDEASGTVARDCGSQAQNGTITNTAGVTLGTTGLLASDPDTAMTFTSASLGYIALPTTGLPTGANTWSVECWTRLHATPGAGKYLVACSLGTKAANTIAEVYYDGDVTQWVFDTDQDALFSATVSTNTLYHLVMTYDGTKYSAYVNGTLIGSKFHTLALAYGSASISHDSDGFYYDDIIDEVSIYGTALSAARIMTHYLAGTSTATLVGVGTLSMSSPSLSAALSMSMTGTGTLAPTLSAALALPSIQLLGSGQLTPSLSASAPLAVTCVGMSQLAMSAPSLSASLAETLTGAGTLSGMLGASLSMTATCAGNGTLTAAMDATTALSTTLSGVGAFAVSSPSLSTALAGEMDGVGTLTATFSLTTSLTGECDGVGTLTATMTASALLICAMDGVGTLVGALSTSSGGTAALAVECDGVSTLVGVLSASTALTVTLAGSGTLAETLALSTALAATCAGTGTLAMSAPSLSASLAETLTGAGTLSGMLGASLSMTATCAGNGTCTGSLAQSTAFMALCAGAGTLAMGNPFLTTALAGKSRGQGMLVASVTLILYALERATTWTTRDLSAAWQARDLSGTWRTRDTTDTWQTRDHSASWEARDLVTTWKED